MTSKRSGKLKIINLFGAPGVGKSSVAAGIFWLMKAQHCSVELVSEYAKYLVLSGRKWQLTEEQVYLFAKQHHKQFVIERSGYEFGVTDSPLQLCQFYAPSKYFGSFEPLVDEASEAFENINFFVTRDLEAGHFEERGRTQGRAEALEVERQMRAFLARKNIPYTELPVDMLAPWRVVSSLNIGQPPVPEFAAFGLETSA
ncbi:MULTISPECIES: AAA family ATPase [unclassified Variovorax]|uniref:AAA family ATPase n=1 Tax=unclassified Variovorax TaxID=663243 RepID=UPI00076D0676|nr:MULTISPECIES: AAA family ATPase [unclassified Variovorax]KWT98403.1 hypothetical protein APY03_0538 [Variovorax sp. WDL1]PNG49928.1 hypothetical protein CHC06_05509 [Variovorax sp. B2]PNG50800.1 hypothetical protein CHC07_05414 [Variovorax sp. B4]VTV18021.1 hypothetical protein WDL1P1_00852 [Variovorax sp. WDL1]